MARQSMTERELKKRLATIEELYRQERLDVMSDELSATVNAMIESLRRDMVDATTTAETPVDKIVKGRLASQEWSRKMRGVWDAWSKRLDMLDALWGRAHDVTPSTLKPLSRIVLEQLRGQLPNGNEPASGMAGRFFHLTEEARQAVTDSMTRSVIMGQSNDEIERMLRTVADQPKARIKAWVRDSNMQYARGVELAYAEDTGEEYFEYMGPVDDVTRPFCKRLEGRILHRSEIDALDNGQTGKGTAMIAGGGYNCRHHWRPVRKEFFGDAQWDHMRLHPDVDEESSVSVPTVPPSMTEVVEPLLLDPDAFLLPKGRSPLSADEVNALMERHFKTDGGEWIGKLWERSRYNRILPAGSAPSLVQRVLAASLGNLAEPVEVRQTGNGEILMLKFDRKNTIAIRQWNTKSEGYEITAEFRAFGRIQKLKVDT